MDVDKHSEVDVEATEMDDNGSINTNEENLSINVSEETNLSGWNMSAEAGSSGTSVSQQRDGTIGVQNGGNSASSIAKDEPVADEEMSDAELSSHFRQDSTSVSHLFFDNINPTMNSENMESTQQAETPLHYPLMVAGHEVSAGPGSPNELAGSNVLPTNVPPDAPVYIQVEAEERGNSNLEEMQLVGEVVSGSNPDDSPNVQSSPASPTPSDQEGEVIVNRNNQNQGDEEAMDDDSQESYNGSSNEDDEDDDLNDPNYARYNRQFRNSNPEAGAAAAYLARRVRAQTSANLEPRTWFVSNPHIRTALRNVMLEARRDAEGAGHYLGNGHVLHNLRRMLFIGNRHRRGEESGSGDENSSGRESVDPAVDEEEVAREGADEGAAAENSSNGEPGTPPDIPISFDRNLPAEHSYLGPNMDRVSGVEFLEPGQTYRLLLFMHEHILFPGEILPFMIHSYVLERTEDQTGLMFGLCFPGLHRPGQRDEMFGVTCHVYERGNNHNGQSLFKSRALQRFIITTDAITGVLQPIANSYARAYGRVKILPEFFLSDPMKGMHMGSMARFRDGSAAQEQFRRMQLASTPLPFHAYDRYNIEHVIQKARNVMAAQKLETMPSDPIQQSFWLMRNLHLSDDLVRKAFITDSVNKRMEIIDSSFVENAHFSCRFCGKKIANCTELFAMSKHGVQTQYCNSAGYIHQTNTVYNVCRNSVSFSGNPSSEFSWFPGYQWQIIVCKRCSHHIGWKFKAEEPGLEPKTFFAITSSSVRISTGERAQTERIPLSRMILSYVATLMDPE